jgi:hypothetical protein
MKTTIRESWLPLAMLFVSLFIVGCAPKPKPVTPPNEQETVAEQLLKKLVKSEEKQDDLLEKLIDKTKDIADAIEKLQRKHGSEQQQSNRFFPESIGGDCDLSKSFSKPQQQAPAPPPEKRIVKQRPVVMLYTLPDSECEPCKRAKSELSAAAEQGLLDFDLDVRPYSQRPKHLPDSGAPLFWWSKTEIEPSGKNGESMLSGWPGLDKFKQVWKKSRDARA